MLCEAYPGEFAEFGNPGPKPPTWFLWAIAGVVFLSVALSPLVHR